MTILSWLRGKKPNKPTEKLRGYFQDYDVWIIRGFLTAKEKRVLLNFYRDEIGTLLEKQTDGELTTEEDHVYRSNAARIKFILDHF